MEIQAFGYLGVSSSSLDDWTAFATTNIGMQPVGVLVRLQDRSARVAETLY